MSFKRPDRGRGERYVEIAVEHYVEFAGGSGAGLGGVTPLTSREQARLAA